MTKFPPMFGPARFPLPFGRLLASALAVAAFSFPALANDAPVITNAAVTPGTVIYLGGVVSVSAQVTDDSLALDTVYAEVRGPSFYSTALSRGGSTPDDFTGGVELPANYTSAPIVWDIYVRAVDLEESETTILAGRVQVESQTSVDEPPLVYDPAINPQALQSTGGPVTLAVSATDLYGIQQAYAEVTGPLGTTVVVLDAVGGDRFSGTFTAPANATRTAVQYAVKMTALDRRSQPTVIDGGQITVAAAAVQTGQLKISPARLAYGKLKIGSHAWKWVLLRNDGKKGTGLISGVIAAPGTPFYLYKGGVRGIPFTLRPGEATACLVEFRPTALGAATATLSIRRADGQQAGLNVSLAGQGVLRK